MLLCEFTIAFHHQKRVAIALSQRYADKPKSEYAEELIYDGFTNADEPSMEKFHNVEWKDRHSIAGTLQDARLKEFGGRLLYVEHPDGMTDQARAERNEWALKRCTTQEKVPWMTIGNAMREADKMLAEANAEGAALLKDFKDYLVDVNQKLAAE